ncbi:hypothetical protein OG470_17760 [Micromonospora sp. NBC_00389]|uniref:hypothetical protein n=1 Tax=Micromonospora sp. NBC_00389 TaxID=2903586 RepID=UPI002E250BA7
MPGVVVHTRTFDVVLEFDSPERRESVRHGLIARNVYPAVLWDIAPEGTPPNQLDFCRRMLHPHTDFR